MTETSKNRPDIGPAKTLDLAHVRVQLLDRVLWVLVLLGGAVTLFIIIRDLIAERYGNAAFYAGAYLLLLIPFALRRAPYAFRAAFTLSPLGAVGVYECWGSGINSTGPVFLLATVVGCCALLGTRAAVLAAGGTLSVLLVLAHFHAQSVARPGEAVHWYLISEPWLIPIMSHLLLCAISVIILSLLLSGLDRSVSKAEGYLVELGQRDAELRETIDTSRDWIWAIDLDGVHRLSNPAVEGMLGYAPDEIVDGSAWELIHPDDQRRVAAEMPSWIAGKQGWEHLVLRWRHRNGEWRYLESNAVPILDEHGEVTGFRGVDRDITDRVEAEEEARRSREQLQALMDVSPAPITWVDQSGEFRYHNRRFHELLGYTEDDLPTVEEWFLRVYPDPEYRQWVRERWEERVARAREGDGRIEPIEVKVRAKDGEVKHVEIEGALLGDRIVVAVSDLTERQRAEASLRASEGRYRALFESAGDAILVMSGDRFTDCNQRALELFRCTRDGIVGRRPQDISPSTQPDGTSTDELARTYIGAAMTGTPQSFEWRHRRADGVLFDAEVNLGAVRAGHEEYMLAIVRDVTERKRVQDELARLAAIVEQASESVVTTDAEGVVTYVNPAFETLSEYTRDEVLGRPSSILKSGVQPPAFYADLWRTISSGNRWQGRFVNRTKSGRHYTVDGTIVPVRDSGGAIKGYTSVRRDVTREAEMEQRLRQAEKMEAMGTLAGGVAHDFNNILGAILGHAQLVGDDLAEGRAVDRASMEEIMIAGQRAKELVRQILAFSRRSELKKSPLRLDSLVKEALRLMRGALPATVRIDRHIDSLGGTVLADATQLHQVVMNLCTNAWQAMQDSGGVLTVELHAITLDAAAVMGLRGMQPGRYAELVVSDTGHGMEPAVQERVFDPFFTTKPKGEGTGMGLAVVHGIVADHGGAITVDSQPGSGAVFRVLLPLHESAEEAKGLADTTTALPGGRETILVVDDEEPLLNVAVRMLQPMGYTVMTRDSAPEALSVLLEGDAEVDLVITDLTMPDITGIELARRVREAGNRLPIILCTGHGGQLNQESAAELGFAHLLRKPVGRDELVLTVRRILDEAQGS